MIDEKRSENDLKGSGRDLLSRHLPGAVGNHGKSLTIACVPAEIRTEHQANTILESYRLTILCGFRV
jgi:hypothetical protein